MYTLQRTILKCISIKERDEVFVEIGLNNGFKH